MRKLTLGLVLFILNSTLLLAQNTLTFEWDPHSQAADLLGFKLYQSKQSGTYSSTPIATFLGGSLTTGSITKPSSPGKWYWVLTAYMLDAESDYSNEVNKVIKPNPPNLKSVTLTALKAPVGGIVKLAKLLKKDKGLRVRDAE